MLFKTLIVLFTLQFQLIPTSSIIMLEEQIDRRIPEDVWMSKIGTIKEIIVPVSKTVGAVSGIGPFRQNQHTRIRLRSNGCSCESLICGCCLDFNIAQFDFQRTGCMNLTVDPREFSVTFNMLWEDEPIYQNVLSGKNPPAMCIPLPVPYIPNLDACVRIFNLSFLPNEQRVHACLDVDARIQRAPVLVLHFDCLQLGSNTTIALVKPTTSAMIDDV